MRPGDPPPSRARIALAITGLLAVGISIVVAFQQPYSLWPWLLLLVGVACAWGSRRVK